MGHTVHAHCGRGEPGGWLQEGARERGSEGSEWEGQEEGKWKIQITREGRKMIVKCNA